MPRFRMPGTIRLGMIVLCVRVLGEKQGSGGLSPARMLIKHAQFALELENITGVGLSAWARDDKCVVVQPKFRKALRTAWGHVHVGILLKSDAVPDFVFDHVICM